MWVGSSAPGWCSTLYTYKTQCLLLLVSSSTGWVGTSYVYRISPLGRQCGGSHHDIVFPPIVLRYYRALALHVEHVQIPWPGLSNFCSPVTLFLNTLPQSPLASKTQLPVSLPAPIIIRVNVGPRLGGGRGRGRGGTLRRRRTRRSGRLQHMLHLGPLQHVLHRLLHLLLHLLLHPLHQLPLHEMHLKLLLKLKPRRVDRFVDRFVDSRSKVLDHLSVNLCFAQCCCVALLLLLQHKFGHHTKHST